ncbi:MAG: hypothetical protein HY548_07520, partial [Elusimicrobia bacterium]|nr:hypothetical protein [Elusimicrobiota bacterium]
MKNSSGKTRRHFWTGLWAALAVWSAVLPAGAIEELKLALERSLEERIQIALNKLVDPNQFLIVVKVEPYSVDEWKQKQASPAFKAPEFILPGIPERTKLDNLSGKQEPPVSQNAFWQGKPFVKRLSVTLFLDKFVSTSLAQEIELLVKQLVDFNPERGDEIRIQRMLFRRQLEANTAPDPKNTVQYLRVSLDHLKGKKDFHWIVMAGVIIMIMAFFFLGCLLFLWRFIRLWQKAVPDESAYAPEPSGAEGTGGADPRGGGGGFGGGGGSFALEVAEPLTLNTEAHASQANMDIFSGEPEKQPYSYVTEKDIISILLLLKDEPPMHLSIIAYYMRAELAAPFIAGLDAAVRKQVVEQLAAPQFLMREEVKSLGQTLKQKVRGIIYGVDQFFAIYDSITPNAQAELMKALEAQTPALAEKMRNEVFTFDDVMSLESGAMRMVFREVPLRTLGIALMGSAAPIRDRVLSVLPSGAAEIIRQEIELNATKNQRAIDEERKKIVAAVRRLVWDKKIVMPTRGRS